MIRVIVAEDRHDVRQQHLDQLEADPEIRVIGEVYNVFDLVNQVKVALPDIILMNVKMPGLNGLEAARQIKVFCSVAGKDMNILTLEQVIYERHCKLSYNRTGSIYCLDDLTETELKILKLIVEGLTNSEIAFELFYEIGYVKNCISNMLSKLQCKNSRGLAAYGAKAGL
jgi:DNA-binding NarL/FixJ family response regulator